MHATNVQIMAEACKEPNTNLTPRSAVIVYPADLQRLIKGRDLTGEVQLYIYMYTISIDNRATENTILFR